MSTTNKRSAHWANRSEESRLRCRATERRGGLIVQCTGNRKIEHEHEHRGKPFGPDFQVPATGGPTLPPSPARL